MRRTLGPSSSFSTRLREIRKANGLTQEEAADLVGVSGPQWCFYERGKRVPSIANLKAICLALDISADWLLELDA